MAKKKEKKIRIGVLIITVVLIITAIAVSFVFVLSYGDGSKKGIKDYLAAFTDSSKTPVTLEEISYIDFKGSERIRFGTYKEFLITADKYKIEAYDKKGSKKWSLPIMLTDPMMKTGRKGILLADTGGRIFYFIEDGEILWYKETEGEIVNGSINDNGYVSIIYEKPGYKGAIAVYDPEGNEAYTRYIADTFVFSSDVFNSKNDSDQTVIISSVDISGIMPNTYLEFTDIRGNPFAGFIPEKGELFPFSLTLDNGSFVLNNESKMVLFDQNREKIEEKIFGSISVVKKSDNNQIIIGVGKAESDLRSILILMDSALHELFSIEIDKIETLDYADKIIAVNTKREVYCYDTKGFRKFIYGSVSDIDEVLVLDSDHVVIITSDKIIFTGA